MLEYDCEHFQFYRTGGTSSHDAEDLRERLNQRARLGWRLADIHALPSGGFSMLVFERNVSHGT